jgi:circadian clock protein KaiC
VVIDPASALSKMGNTLTAHSVAERLLDWAKSNGITLLCTSLLESPVSNVEATPLQISTLADTWIHLSYLIHAGERNRCLSVIKSRGSAHSNQVRELVLSDRGVTLTDAYSAGGEVLMGTLRWEKERAEQAARFEANAVAMQKQARLVAEQAELEMRLSSLQREIENKRAERVTLSRVVTANQKEDLLGRLRMRELRGADAANSNHK